MSLEYYAFQKSWPASTSCPDRMVVGFTTTYAISTYHH